MELVKAYSSCNRCVSTAVRHRSLAHSISHSQSQPRDIKLLTISVRALLLFPARFAIPECGVKVSDHQHRHFAQALGSLGAKARYELLIDFLIFKLGSCCA